MEPQKKNTPKQNREENPSNSRIDTTLYLLMTYKYKLEGFHKLEVFLKLCKIPKNIAD